MGKNPSPEDQLKRANDYLIVVPDFIRLKDYDLALLQVERALAIDPGNARALEYKKRIIAIQGRLGQPSSPPPVAEIKPDEKEILQNRKQEKLRELEEERRRLEKIRQEFEELQREEEELHRKEEEERKRRIEEIRKVEEQRRQEEEERRNLLELKKKEEEQKRQEELKRKQEEEERLRLEEEERKKKEEEERKKQEELRKQQEEEERKRQEELRRKQEEEERRKQEELRREREEEERKKQEELRRKQEEERKKQEDLKRKQEEERRRQEDVRKKQEEERQQKIYALQSQLEGLKQEEERHKQQDEETRRKQQEQEKRRHDEERRSADQKRKREEEQKRKAAEHKTREEEQKRREEELRRREVEHMIQMDPVRRLEEETRLAKEKKDRVHAQITVAEDFFNSGNYEQALIEVSKILDVDPSYPRALTLRLRVKQAQDKHKDRATAKKAEKPESVAETTPVVEPVIVEKKKAMGSIKWTGIAVLVVIVGIIVVTQMRKHRAPEVVPQSKPAAEVAVAKPSPETTKTPIEPPASAVVPTVTAEEHLTRANLFVQHRSFQSALQEFDSAAVLAPKRVETFVSEADVDLKVGEYAEALKALAHAAELAPGDITILQMTAFACHLNGAYGDGLKYHEQVLSLTTDSIKYLMGPVADAILFDKALLSKYGGRVKAAFEGILSGISNDFVNRYRYARLLLALGSTREANDLLKKNVDYLVEEYQSHPNDGRVTMYLALSMTRLGHFAEAEGFAKDARSLARENPEILYKIAQMYALQMHSSQGQAAVAQMKKKALQAVHDAVNLRFMLDELTNADLSGVYGKDFAAAARLPLK